MERSGLPRRATGSATIAASSTPSSSRKRAASSSTSRCSPLAPCAPLLSSDFYFLICLSSSPDKATRSGTFVFRDGKVVDGASEFLQRGGPTDKRSFFFPFSRLPTHLAFFSLTHSCIYFYINSFLCVI